MVLAVAVAALAVPRRCSAAAVLRVTARSPVRTLRAATSLQVKKTSSRSCDKWVLVAASERKTGMSKDRGSLSTQIRLRDVLLLRRPSLEGQKWSWLWSVYEVCFREVFLFGVFPFLSLAEARGQLSAVVGVVFGVVVLCDAPCQVSPRCEDAISCGRDAVSCGRDGSLRLCSEPRRG